MFDINILESEDSTQSESGYFIHVDLHKMHLSTRKNKYTGEEEQYYEHNYGPYVKVGSELVGEVEVYLRKGKINDCGDDCARVCFIIHKNVKTKQILFIESKNYSFYSKNHVLVLSEFWKLMAALQDIGRQ